MNAVWLAARREIVVRARTKGYIISLVISGLMVAVLAFLPTLLFGSDSYTVGLVDSAALRPAAQKIASEQEITLTFREFPDERAARAAITDGQIDAAVVGNATLLADGEVDEDLGTLLQGAHRAAQTEERLRAAGIDPVKVGEAMAVPPLEEVSVVPLEGDAGARVGFATMLVIILFFLLMSAITTVAMGVVEEKGSRIVELLLTAIRPWQLLSGKIIGLGVLGLVNLLVIAAVGLGTAFSTGLASDLPANMLGIVAATVGWFLLGYAFFSTVAAALGALVSRQEEVGSVLTPLTILLTATYLVSFNAAFEPSGTLARVLSVVPPFSSMVMPVRMAGTPVPAWEIALAVLLMALAVAVVLRIGARVYERAVLRTGARVRLSEVIRRRPDFSAASYG